MNIHIYIYTYINVYIHMCRYVALPAIAAACRRFFTWNPTSNSIILPSSQEPAAPVPEAPKPNCWANVLPRSGDTSNIWRVEFHIKQRFFTGY